MNDISENKNIFFNKEWYRNLFPIQSEEEEIKHWELFKLSRTPIENKK